MSVVSSLLAPRYPRYILVILVSPCLGTGRSTAQPCTALYTLWLDRSLALEVYVGTPGPGARQNVRMLEKEW